MKRIGSPPAHKLNVSGEVNALKTYKVEKLKTIKNESYETRKH